MRDVQARIEAFLKSAGTPGLALFTVYLRGGPEDGQRRQIVLRPDQVRVGERIGSHITVEHGKREANWPWTKTVFRRAEYEIISVESGLAVARFVGEHEWP